MQSEARMKMQRVFLFPVLIAAVIGIILMLSAREPRYRGRSLTSWLQQCYETPLNESQRLAEAQQAVRAMPLDKVLPRLLRLVEARDDPVSPWIMAKSDEFRLRFLKWRSAEDFQQLGIAGFEALGTNAVPVIGELTSLLADKQHAFTAVRCLVAIGTPAEAAVSQALTNKSEEVRCFATQQFGWVTDDTEDFLAHMKKCLNDPDGSVRFAAVQGIGLQTQAPDSAIPLLLEALRDKQDTVSSWAAKFLADFGTNAVRTFPDLSNAVENGSPNTVYQALKTLVAIAPDEALPIVFNNFRSTDLHRRRISVELLYKYPATNLEIQTAIQQAATDPDPALARRAKELITKKYQAEHPVESQFSDEPNFGGKSLGEWLKMHDSEGTFSEDAKQALQHMGTNAIPALLERLVYVQPPFGLRASDVNLDAVRAFITLGEQAKLASPKLQALMGSTNQDIALFAMLATCGTGSNAVPILIKGLTNQFPDVRNEAAHYLTDGPCAQFPEQRKQAIPLFVKLLDDPDENVRMNATNELKEIDPEAAAKAGIK
jgi:HEAT repeat protein